MSGQRVSGQGVSGQRVSADRRRWRLRAWRFGFMAAIGVSPVLLASSAPAAQALGGWNVNADANVVDIVIDNTTGLAGVHPLTEADFPEAQSTFQTGPFGSGLAAVVWPGSAGGNFGSLSAELPIPAQLQPIFSKLNDPARANAQYPAGPSTSTYPKGGSNNAVEMISTAGAGGTTATAALTDINENSYISFSSAKGTSASTASSTAKATATSDLSGIALLGGLIDIGSLTSTATATSTGATATGSSTTHVGAVTVAGQTASIGSDGLVLPKIQLPPSLGLANPLNPIVQAALDQVVSGLGLKATTFPSTQTTSGASDTISSGGVQLQITPNPALAPLLETAFQTLFKYIPLPPQAAVIPTLPGILQGATLTITLGRSIASASGSPPFSSGFTPPPVSPVTSTPSTGGQTTTPYTPGSSIPGTPGHFVPGTPGSAIPGTSPALGGLPTSGSPPSGVPVPSASTGPTKLIDLSSPLGAGAVVLGALVAVAFAFGLFRLARMLLPEDAAPVCPLGQDTP